MKSKGTILGLCVALTLTLAGGAWSFPMELDNVVVTYNADSLQRIYPALTNSNDYQLVYTEYWFDADYFNTSVEAFCVQNVLYDPGQGQSYSLVSPYPSPYNDVGQDTWNQVLVIAHEGFSDERIYQRAAYQVAIWNVLYGVNVSAQLNNPLYYRVEDIVSNTAGASAPGGNFLALAVSPASQNFLLNSPAPVPEPATLLLLGAGLLGIVGVSRKKFRK